MDSKRIQAYVNLIEQLLNCPDGEVSQILNDNRELVDAGLLQVMVQVAEQLEADKNQKAANFLRYLSSQLVETLGISETSTSASSPSQDYLQFLMEVLQATRDNIGNSEVIYALLQANLDKLDNNFIAVLQTWAETTLPKMEPSQAEGMVIALGNFSILLSNFPLGSKVANMEISIASYEIMLTVFTRHSHPEIWANIQNSLGNAYKNRIQGDTAENLELALAAYELALEVRTKEAFPTDWAATQNNLGNAYRNRIQGDTAENLELALAAYELALEVRTKEAFPTDWAMTQNNLGNVYCDRIQGDTAKNLELALAAYQKALLVRTKETFPINWAATQNNLGVVYKNRIQGDTAKNLELALAAYERALEVRTKEAFPIDWAETQNNLGSAYSNRIQGDTAENLELALAAYERALEVRTKEAFPIDWAATQIGLGEAYRKRIQGDTAENLELALAAYQKALEVYTKEAFPSKWAMAQNNLGIAYCDRIQGDTAENLEMAVAASQKVLEVYTKEAFPTNWAGTQNNLGNAYCDRIQGDTAENLEFAIAAYEQALEVRTKESFPTDWAATQNNLGIAYRNRIQGDTAENLEFAIAAYERALEVRTKESFPTDWAATQNNLGEAYRNRIQGDTAENLEFAIAAYQKALEVYTKEAFPSKWAMTQNNLGNAYTDRIQGDTAENLEFALTTYERALEVYAKEAFPTDWAMTQNNLGNAYRNRIKGYRAKNLEMAVAAYERALSVYTPKADPISCLATSRNLGNLHFTESDWQKAIDAYEKAITAVELSRSWAITDDRRQKIIAEAIEVYQAQVQAYINIKQWDQAIETVERSKTRNLVELLYGRDLYPKGDIPQETIAELDRLRRNIPSLERQLQGVIDSLSANTSEPEEPQRRSLEKSQQHLQQELQFSRQQLDEVLDRIKPIDSSFSLTQRVEQIAFSDIQGLIDDRTAIIEWYVAGNKILTFILTANSLHPLVEQVSGKEREALIDWGNDYLDAYDQKEKEQWKADLASNLKRLAELLNIDRLLTLIEEIFDQQGKKCDRLILIPHRFLHLFPLHAMPLSNGDLLMERFPRGLGYAPSLQLLQLSQTWSRPSFERFFCVQDPTEDLSFTDLEVATIRTYFDGNDDVLERKKARKTALTPERLAQVNIAHFSCHGYFNFESPNQSALLLAGSKDTATMGDAIDLEKCLTLGEIFALDLRQCRLTTLSACETGLTDFKSLGDEYISLPSGFLYAGSPSVVSSLWTVNDLSTAFLIIQFYNNLQHPEEYPSVALALNKAQLWLRQVTKNSLQKWIESQISPNKTLKMYLQRYLQKISDDARPFESPFYWAAFCAIGQ